MSKPRNARRKFTRPSKKVKLMDKLAMTEEQRKVTLRGRRGTA